MARYLINVLASEDLNEIAEYFQVNNVRAGEKLFQNFDKKCKQLVSFPNSGKSYEDIYPNLKGIPLSCRAFKLHRPKSRNPCYQWLSEF